MLILSLEGYTSKLYNSLVIFLYLSSGWPTQRDCNVQVNILASLLTQFNGSNWNSFRNVFQFRQSFGDFLRGYLKLWLTKLRRQVFYLKITISTFHGMTDWCFVSQLLFVDLNLLEPRHKFSPGVVHSEAVPNYGWQRRQEFYLKSTITLKHSKHIHKFIVTITKTQYTWV